ncbi:MAG: GAF domain-containing protein [Anaerolineae bacterium]|nr:GAF domain-containing protein [Anaerolineae bacterium]
MNESQVSRAVQTSSVRDVQILRERLILGILRAASVIGLLVVVGGTYDSYMGGEFWTLPFYWGAYLTIVSLLIWRSAPYRLRVWAFAALLYILGFIDFFQDGTSGSSRVFLLVLPFIMGIFLGRRASAVGLVVGMLTMAGFAWAYTGGFIVSPTDPTSTDPAKWIAATLTFTLLGSLIVISIGSVVQRLSEELGRSQDLAQQLDKQRLYLEEQVGLRTQALGRRSTQLETASRVARDAAAIQDMERLLRESVRLISDRFGFYHSGIFLLDESRQHAVLRAASSEGGRKMLQRGHQLRVGELGIVGYVTGRGEPRIALDVGSDAVFFNNPDLPETHSELALPLRVRGEIIGALDVQSREPAAFSEEDVAVLQTLADQLAMAINNARLLERVQQSLEAERRAYGDLRQQAWNDLMQTRKQIGYRYSQGGVVSLGWEEAAETEGRAGRDGDASVMTLVLKVGDRVVGTIQAEKPGGVGRWDEEEVAVLEDLSDQLGVALESARLYQETQRREAQERLVGEITARVRETLDVETVLKTAVDELYENLGLGEVVIRLASPEFDAKS